MNSNFKICSKNTIANVFKIYKILFNRCSRKIIFLLNMDNSAKARFERRAI